jgi:hypothetical protein
VKFAATKEGKTTEIFPSSSFIVVVGYGSEMDKKIRIRDKHPGSAILAALPF